jgi:hypothetical protein
MTRWWGLERDLRPRGVRPRGSQAFLAIRFQAEYLACVARALRAVGPVPLGERAWICTTTLSFGGFESYPSVAPIGLDLSYA